MGEWELGGVGMGRDGNGMRLRASRWSWSRTAKPCSLGKAAAWPARRFLAPEENKKNKNNFFFDHVFDVFFCKKKNCFLFFSKFPFFFEIGRKLRS